MRLKVTRCDATQCDAFCSSQTTQLVAPCSVICEPAFTHSGERASNLIVSIGNFTHNANCPRVRDAQSGVGEYKRGVAWPEGSAPRTDGRFKLLLAQLHTLSKTHSTRQLQHFSTVSTTVTRETHRK